MSTIINRIGAYMHHKGISTRQFEIAIGASNGVISRALKDGKDIQSKWVSIIIETYKELNAEWLLTGKGEMTKSMSYALREDNDEPHVAEEPGIVYAKQCRMCKEKDERISDLKDRIVEQGRVINTLQMIIDNIHTPKVKEKKA